MIGRNSTKWKPGIRIRAANVLDGFRLRLTFSDGSIREIDLDSYLHGPVFEPLRTDRKLFQAVRVYPEGDAVYWSNGADIAPETLYEESTVVQTVADLKATRRGAGKGKSKTSVRRAKRNRKAVEPTAQAQ